MSEQALTCVSGVYGLVYKPDGDMYVGSSKDVERRTGDHVNSLRRGHHHSRRLQRKWNSSCEFDWVAIVLEQCDSSQLVDREQYWMDHIDSSLNVSRNAACPPLDPAVARRIGDAKRGKKNPAVGLSNKIKVRFLGHTHSEYSKELIRHAHIGSKMGPASDERKRKIAEALRGVPLTEERKRRISEARKGKPLTDLQRSHLSRLHQSQRGRVGSKHSEETKQRLREVRLGMKFSDEVRRHMSEGAKKRWCINKI